MKKNLRKIPKEILEKIKNQKLKLLLLDVQLIFGRRYSKRHPKSFRDCYGH
jgi:adenylate kinase